MQIPVDKKSLTGRVSRGGDKPVIFVRIGQKWVEDAASTLAGPMYHDLDVCVSAGCPVGSVVGDSTMARSSLLRFRTRSSIFVYKIYLLLFFATKLLTDVI
jgi:hypothetical protein